MNYHLYGVRIPHVGYGRMIECLEQNLSRYVGFDERAEAAIYAVPPDMVKGWWEGQRTACLTMWETTHIPDRYRRTMRMFDRLIVPCDWNVELFAPTHDDIHVMPLGVDHATWHPVEVADNQRFRFITGGSGWKRKGIQQIIDAFRTLNLPDSELLIKCTPDLLDDPKSYEFGPNIHVVKEKLTVEQERDFYASADCFVSATRGEGFGMIPLQNLALGNRVIAPAHTGHLMFSDLFDYQLGWKMGTASMQYFVDCGEWFVPNDDELLAAMADAYRTGRPPLAERWERHNRTLHLNWDATVRRLMELFPPGPIINGSEWTDAGGKTIQVRALRNVQADVGVYKIRLRKDEVAGVPISTLNHLFEVGAVTEI